DLDIAITGDTGGGGTTRIYRNSGGVSPTFTDIGAGLSSLIRSSVAWGDYDHDGDLDLALAGSDALPRPSIYPNSRGANPTCTDIAANVTGVDWASVGWGDYDNDGDLDLLVAGTTAGTNGISRIYRNSGGAAPTFSDAIAGLTGVFAGAARWVDINSDG